MENIENKGSEILENPKFKELIDHIRELNAIAEHNMEMANRDVEKLIKMGFRDLNQVDHFLDQIMELCYQCKDHSVYLKLIDYVKTIDTDLAESHFALYQKYVLNNE